MQHLKAFFDEQGGVSNYMSSLGTDLSAEDHSDQLSPAYWIFQGNPKYYDVVGAISNLKTITWGVNQYSKQIKKI